MIGSIVRALLKLFYRVEVKGQENFAAAGESVLVVINVGSLLDPILIGGMLPERVTIAVDKRLASKWWMRHILALTDVLEIDFSSPTSTLRLVRIINSRRRVMVFHEARFQNDPHFMKILEATGVIAEKAKAKILPVCIDGAAYSRFSYFRHKVRLRWFPKVTLTVLPPQSLTAPADLSARERRRRVAVQLYGVMTELLCQSQNSDWNILQKVADASSIYGRKYIIAEDQDRKTLTYGGLLTKSQAVGRGLGRIFRDEEYVGFMLPSSLAGVVAFLGLHVSGKVPAMLNFTSGTSAIISACKTIQLKSVLTARKFVELAELGELVKALEDNGLRVIYMEDVAAGLRLPEKLGGAVAAFFRRAPKTPSSAPVAILFTSGTEGMPKAVFMSHRNTMANHVQMLSVVNLGAGDRLFNCLPMFHTFGLGVGVLLPLCSGMRCILYPSPLHYRNVPQLFYDSLATIICGTDTFFTGYARYGQPYDFFNARLVIAGAEKLRESTARTYLEKFNVKMLEGYGATETSPVIAFNTAANTKAGSVGRLLPGLRCQLKPLPGLDDPHSGAFWVKGDNVMLGYMRSGKPGVLEPPVDPDIHDPVQASGWYDTGDIVSIDAENYIFIQGRAKRFAKVGGEMISLAAVENALRDIWPDAPLGIVAVSDARKGEQLVLIIQHDEVQTSRIAAYFASRGFSPLWTPKKIICVKQAPLLGAGKFDYIAAKKLVEQQMAN